MNLDKIIGKNIEKENEEERMLNIKVVSSLDEETAGELAFLEKEIFRGYNEKSLLSKKDFLDYAENPENIILLARKEGLLAGYAVVIQFKDVIESLVEYDPEIVNEDIEDKYYGESIAIIESLRKQKAAVELTRSVVDEIKKRGAKKFVVHIRSKRGSHDEATGSFLTKGKILRTIPDWLGTGKDFDYVEYEI